MERLKLKRSIDWRKTPFLTVLDEKLSIQSITYLFNCEQGKLQGASSSHQAIIERLMTGVVSVLTGLANWFVRRPVALAQVSRHYQTVIYLMHERKIWTGQEDGVLLKLVSGAEVKKWNQIARNMEIDYSIPGRTGKQCRERWYNTLNPSIKGENWSAKDSMKLFEYHTIYGNRWAKIATLFGNRSDNSVKNHFYSTLRKAHRIINKFIKQHKRKFSQRPLKDSILSKIISLSEERQFSDHPSELVSKAKQLLVHLVEISQSTTEEFSMSFMEVVVYGLLEINKAFKLKKINKRRRKQTVQQGTNQSENSSVSESAGQRQPAEPSVPSSESQSEKKGFKLFDQSSPNVMQSSVNFVCGFTPNLVQQPLGGVWMMFNNEWQYVMCCQTGSTLPSNLVPQLDYSPQVLYSQMWPCNF